MPARDTNDEMPGDPVRIVMMGTGPFAVPMFEAILKSPHRVLALVTRPDRPSHRRDKSPVNPMRETARGHGLEVFEPESINSAEAQKWLREQQADLFVVCDYGQILSRETLSLARLGGINLHASLLPKYRGAAPINWAIYHGEQESGVTVIHMTPKLDAGPALVQQSTPIGANETAPELELRLGGAGEQRCFGSDRHPCNRKGKQRDRTGSEIGHRKRRGLKKKMGWSIGRGRRCACSIK